MDKSQEQMIVTSAGNRYMATYAGNVGNIKYFECKDPVTGKKVGFVASVAQGHFGPMCTDFINATIRARNIADSKFAWWTRMFARSK